MMTMKKTLLMISFAAVAVPAFSFAAKAKSPATRLNAQATASGDVVRSTDDDPIGEWIEKNGARFGLYQDDLKKKPAAPKQTAPQKPVKAGAKKDANLKKIVANPEDILSGQSQRNEQAADPIAQFANSGGDSEPYVQKKVFTPPPAALQSNDAAAQIAAVMDDLDFNSKCGNFANKNGFGAWGKTIVEELVRGNGNSMLQGTDDLRRACPNYDYLGVREKSYVWVKVIASMSFLESSCDTQAGITRVVKGPNGRAVGLLQLHQNREGGYAENCNNKDSMNAIKTLKCGISMLDRQIEKTSALFSSQSYWGVLRPQGDLVKTKRGKKRVVLARTVIGGLKELPFCQR